MNLLNKLFTKSKIDCPRCLGKGKVDLEDIKRLKKELIWLPGKCAYCNGLGKVSSDMPTKVSVDNSYLTIDITQEERNKLINNDPDAIERANHFDAEIDDYIKQVKYLHFVAKLEANMIADFYLIPKANHEILPNEKEDLLNYIEKIINSEKEN
ncbi:MAG: hypothetical protein Q8K02_15355 [Flavobacterium sp.]|nr:hypothetical protein [Flavobacterium sp.]